MSKRINYGIDENTNSFRASQDVTQYIDYAAEMRAAAKGNAGWNSFCIVPDIVAIDIFTKHKIDVHSKEFGSDQKEMSRFKKIVKSEFPYLLTGGVSNRFNLYTGDK